MDTKNALNPASDGNFYIYVVVNLFNNYIVKVPTPKSIAHFHVNAIFHH